MYIEVHFETKMNIQEKDTQKQEIQYYDVSGSICQENGLCVIQLRGNKVLIIETLRIVWELNFLYDGYFYKPIKYMVDGKEKDPLDLYFLSFYKIGKIWKNVASPLVDSKDFSEEKLLAYYTFRNTGRDSGRLVKSLVNSFYYLHSEAYEKINVNHRLSLLLNICDGFIINTNGVTKNSGSNIGKVLSNLDVKLIKYGASLLGIPQSKLYDALAQERNEIDHYIFKVGSVTDYVFNGADERKDYLSWYFIFVLELALRIALLKQIGIKCSDTCVEFATNDINDWIILECKLPDNCKNPLNKMKQDMRRLGIIMR